MALPDCSTASRTDRQGVDPAGADAVTAAVTGRPARWLIICAIVLIAANMRPAVASVGALLGRIQPGLGMSGTVAGVLTTLPALCFAVFGALAPLAARRYGAERMLCGGVAMLVAGLLARAAAPGVATFILASAFALAGIAATNVLLPVLVKHHFPDRVGPMTGLYSMVLTLGTATAAAATVPLTHAIGHGWRAGIGLWALLAAMALTASLGLLPIRPLPRRGRASATRIGASQLRRSPVAWSLAVFFGMQSLSAYAILGWLPRIFTDAGFSPTTAGLLLALTQLVPVPLALALPALAARTGDQRPYVAGLVACYVVGYVGLIAAPASGAVLWAVLIGVGSASFPLALTMIGLRSRTSAGTSALSGFTQGIGYLLAAAGPLLMGVLYEVTGGWTVPLIVLGVFLVPQLVGGLFAGRPRVVEDDL